MLTADEVLGRIRKLRVSLLAFRYLYYCKSESIVTDFEYDRRETELRSLVEDYPEIAEATAYHNECPTRTVGSSESISYPDEAFHLAESLLHTYDELKAGKELSTATTEELLTQLNDIAARISVPRTVRQPSIFDTI